MAGAEERASVGRTAARPCTDVVDTIAQVEVLGARHRFALFQFDLEVSRLVADVVERGAEL